MRPPATRKMSDPRGRPLRLAMLFNSARPTLTGRLLRCTRNPSRALSSCPCPLPALLQAQLLLCSSLTRKLPSGHCSTRATRKKLWHKLLAVKATWHGLTNRNNSRHHRFDSQLSRVETPLLRIVGNDPSGESSNHDLERLLLMTGSILT